MALVAGVDSSTQSCKVVVCDAGSGAVVREGRAPHPDGTEVDPEAWWSALGAALRDAGALDGVEALAVGGQQHGMVAVDASGTVVRPALLWNDTRSAPAAADLVEDLGGPAPWATATGSVPVASFTVTKLRWLADHEPAAADRVAAVLLPHDWLTWRLAGGGPGGDPGGATTDRGDASGTGYWGASGWRRDLLELALRGRSPALPRVTGPAEVVGTVAGSGTRLGPGTGDNMGAALGIGADEGDVVVSLGTSGTVFAVAEAATFDESGLVAGFADATGRWLPLVCTLNCARVLDTTAALLGVDAAGLDRLALEAPAGAGGLVLLPYLDGERTPNLPDATGSLHGLTRSSMTPAGLARAAVEGVLCGLADGLDALRAAGVRTARVLLVGGAARSAAVQALAPSLLGLPVVLPPPGEYVALGAARQAAWALGGGTAPPVWGHSTGGGTALDLGEPEAWGDDVRAAYAAARRAAHGA